MALQRYRPSNPHVEFTLLLTLPSTDVFATLLSSIIARSYVDLRDCGRDYLS